MIMCRDCTVETWSPDFSSSGQSNPIWTRVRFEGAELVNTLEWVDWGRNPVQVELCDACGTPDCRSGGYVHVSRFDGFVLWTAPQEINVADEWAVSQYEPASVLKKFGAIAVPDEKWKEWKAIAHDLPAPPVFPRANGRALAEAWALGPGRPARLEVLIQMLRHRLVACDTLQPEEAIHRVEYWLSWFHDRGSVPIQATLESPDSLGATVETLYFDGPSSEDWIAFARRGELEFVALDSDHVLVLRD
jgi:hypothetical protein